MLDAAGVDTDEALSILKTALAGADDGELFLERSESESLVFDDGRLKSAAYDATEGFGLYALSGKATAFLAPFLIASVTAATGNQRLGISPLIVMFLLSLVLLIWVKAKGEAEP